MDQQNDSQNQHAAAQNPRPNVQTYLPPNTQHNPAAESQNLRPVMQPHIPPNPQYNQAAVTQNIRPIVHPNFPQAGPSDSQGQAGPSNSPGQAGPSQNQKPRGLPHLPIDSPGKDYTIKPGHVFSKCYQDMAPAQSQLCLNCRPLHNHFHYRANLVQPEDLCVRCLVAVGHWSKDLYADNNKLKNENRSFSAHLRNTYKTVLCKFYPDCPQGSNCVYAHGEEDRREVNQHDFNLNWISSISDVLENRNDE